MFAKNLETLLSNLCQKSDVSTSRPNEIAARFDVLRRYGVLPRGRKNRAQLLTRSQIAAAILGLASSRPEWAGITAKMLSKLHPVSGLGASFFDADSLLKAIVHVLSDAEARSKLITLRASTAESGINSHGYLSRAEGFTGGVGHLK